MTTRAKLYISSYTASIMMMLVVFSKPLRIPDAIQWILLLAVFIALWLMFRFNKKLKQEKLAPATTGDIAPPPVTEPSKKAKNRLILMMVIGVLIGLCAPLWMPVTGTTLGHVGDLICGLISAAVVCIIVGLRLRKL